MRGGLGRVNEGLAGAPAEEMAAARDTATNPAVLDAVAPVICEAEGPRSIAAACVSASDFLERNWQRAYGARTTPGCSR